MVKSQTSSFHTHLFDSTSTLPNTAYLPPLMGPSIYRPQSKEISFDWKDPSPHSIDFGIFLSIVSPKKIIPQPSPIKEVTMVRNPIPEPTKVFTNEASVIPNKPQNRSFPQFPTLISSQVLPSQRSHITSSQSSLPRSTEPIRDWSAHNKSWIDKRHSKSSIPKPSSTKTPAPSSMPLSQLMQSQNISSQKRPSQPLPPSSTTQPNWRVKLENESRNLPDFKSSIQGEYSLRLRDSVLKRESFFQLPSRSSVPFHSQSFQGYNEYDYASVLGISTAESIHRILLLFHSRN